VDIDRPLGNRQAQARSTAIARARFIDSKETMKDALAMLGGDARPFVANRKHRPVPEPLNADRDGRAGRPVLDRIVQDVGDCLAQNEAVARDDDAIRDIEAHVLVALLGQDDQ
jgi:hypothetical protein